MQQKRAIVDNTFCGGSASEAFAPPCPPSDGFRYARVATLLTTEVISHPLYARCCLWLWFSLDAISCDGDDCVDSTIFLERERVEEEQRVTFFVSS